MPRRQSSNGKGRDIIVIGASAGGVQALQDLMRGFPPDLPAAVFVVVHTSPSSPGVLPQILDRAGPLPAISAEDGQQIRHGRIYVAPPDVHLLLRRGHMQVTRGPKENGFRPAVDALFRTAARSHGPRVVGVVLTGGLDDGTVGLTHIKAKGGVAVVQEPSEAVFPSMPQSAIENVEVDHVVPVAEMPALLVQLATEALPKGVLAMANRDQETPDPAEVGQAGLLDKVSHGPPTPITCPECGGALWERKDGKVFRYQCHVGHSYTADALVAQKSEQLESVLWTALRALEENAELRHRMARRAMKGPPTLQQMGQKYENEAKDAERRAAALREVLTNGKGLTTMVRAGSAERTAKRAASRSVGRGQKSNGKSRRRGNGRD